VVADWAPASASADLSTAAGALAGADCASFKRLVSSLRRSISFCRASIFWSTVDCADAPNESSSAARAGATDRMRTFMVFLSCFCIRVNELVNLRLPERVGLGTPGARQGGAHVTHDRCGAGMQGEALQMP